MSKRSDRVRAALESSRSRAGSNGWVRVRCVFCLERTGKEDRRGSLGVNTENGFFHCFKCEAKGRLDGFSEDDDFFDTPPVTNAAEVALPAEFAKLYDREGLRSLSLNTARSYLAKRGLDPAVLRAAGVGACVEGRYAGRVVVPITNAEGRSVGFSARAWIKKHPVPYLYPPEMDRAAVIYNEAALRVETDLPVMIVEGVLDALALWPDAAAVLGKPSDWQVDRLVEAARPVAVVFDGDAWEEGWSFAQKLRLRGCRAGSVVLPAKADPDEVDREVLTQAARVAVEEGEAECLQS